MGSLAGPCKLHFDDQHDQAGKNRDIGAEREPAVEAVEPVEQGVGEGVFEAAAGDLPKLRQALLDAGWDVARAGAMEQADARVTFH